MIIKILNKIMNQSKKQKWIKAEHDKAVQIHWDNLARIRKLKEDFGSAWTQRKPYSTKEAQSIMDKSIREYAKILRKAEYKIIKDWLSKAKSGVIDYFDVVRGIEVGDASRAHPFETKFLKGIIDRDKVMNRFRSYFDGKKGMKNRKVGR